MQGQTNRLNLTRDAYSGKPSTLCKGCGHDSITNGIISAYYELGVQPYEIMKLSGIGCSSKTPTYFLEKSHGFNGVHGRMPALATGAHMANHLLGVIGVSGDGDSMSIGLGQFCHLVRRNVNMVYIIENNGTYGLTKGQFSATSDQNSKSKKGEVNPYAMIDVCELAINLGATFVARSFSGDRKQMTALLKAAHSHKGIAILDIISPCVTFNNHDDSTKSYTYVKDHDVPLHELGFVPHFDSIEVEIEEGASAEIKLHDGSILSIKKIDKSHDPTDKLAAIKTLLHGRETKDIPTGLIYYHPDQPDLIQTLNVVDEPLSSMTEADTDPGAEVLAKINAGLK